MDWRPDSQPQSPLVLPDLPGLPGLSFNDHHDATTTTRFTPKFLTGSVSGYSPWPVTFGSSYLSASSAKTGQPLCANEEGWGPLSPYRWDFTPCFIDVWIASVAVFGVVFGVGALLWLYKKRAPRHDLSKNWHYYIKQVSLPDQPPSLLSSPPRQILSLTCEILSPSSPSSPSMSAFSSPSKSARTPPSGSVISASGPPPPPSSPSPSSSPSRASSTRACATPTPSYCSTGLAC